MYWCVFYFPISDSDALASYVARFKLEEIGSLRQVATLSLQVVFPRFFDRLLYQCSQWEWFHALPSFSAFLIILWCLFRAVPRKSYPWVLFVLLCSPVLLTQSMSQKNDIAVASFAILGVTIASSVRNPIAFLPLCLLSMSMLVGTKWTAIPLAALIGIFTTVRLLRDPPVRPRLLTVGVILLMLPVYAYTSSAATYVENARQYGSVMPVLPDMDESYPGQSAINLNKIPDRIVGTIIGTLVDVGRLPLVLARDLAQTDLFPALSLGRWYLISDRFVDSHGSVGPLLLPMLLVNLLTLAGRWGLGRYRWHAAIALLYYVIVVVKLPLSVGTSRYLLPTYVLSAPATACLLRRWIDERRRWLRRFCWALAVYLSSTTILLSKDRTLVQVFPDKEPFTHYLEDHDNLMFLGLPGFIDFFKDYRKYVTLQDSLLILDDTQLEHILKSEVPIIYPFLRRRVAANTAILHMDRSEPADWTRYDFVLSYSRRDRVPSLPGFEQVSSTYWPCCRLFRKMTPASRIASE